MILAFLLLSVKGEKHLLSVDIIAIALVVPVYVSVSQACRPFIVSTVSARSSYTTIYHLLLFSEDCVLLFSWLS